MIYCEGECGQWFHTECVGMSDKDFKNIQVNKKFKYKCQVC